MACAAGSRNLVLAGHAAALLLVSSQVLRSGWVPLAAVIVCLLPLAPPLIVQALVPESRGRGTLALVPFLPLFSLYCLLLACLAWCAKLRSRRWGSLRNQAVMLAFGVAPFVVHSVMDYRYWTIPDPGHPKFIIRHAFLGADGKHAYLGCSIVGRGAPHHSLRVNLDTGSWEASGYHYWDYSPRHEGMGSGLQSGEVGRHRLLVRLARRSKNHRPLLFDTRTGASLTALSRARGIDAKFDGLLRTHLRDLTPHRLPDGRRFWQFKGRLEAEDGSGFELLPGCIDGGSTLYRMSAGSFWVWGPRQIRGQRTRRILDLHSFQFVDIPKGLSGLVLADVWVVTEKYEQSTIFLIDPVTRERRDMPGARKGDRVGPSFSDGSFLLLRWRSGKRAAGELEDIYHVHDPKIGDMRRVKIPLHVKLTWLGDPRVPAYTPSGARVLRSSSGYWLRFDKSDSRLSITARTGGRLMACESEDRILIRTDRTIVRLYFGSGRKEQLFPRPAGDQR